MNKFVIVIFAFLGCSANNDDESCNLDGLYRLKFSPRQQNCPAYEQNLMFHRVESECVQSEFGMFMSCEPGANRTYQCDGWFKDLESGCVYDVKVNHWEGTDGKASN